MTDVEFGRLCNTYGFAPSRALRELIDCVLAQEILSCAALAEKAEPYQAADLIRARAQASPPLSKPLPLAEVERLYVTAKTPVAFARAIERAHGITRCVRAASEIERNME